MFCKRCVQRLAVTSQSSDAMKARSGKILAFFNRLGSVIPVLSRGSPAAGILRPERLQTSPCAARGRGTAKARGAAATTGTSQPPRRIWSLLQLCPRASASREPGQPTQPTPKQALSSHGAPRVALLGRVRGGPPPGHVARGVDGAVICHGDEPPGAGHPETNTSSEERIGRDHVGPRGEAGNWD